jgi:hypothetical protein
MPYWWAILNVVYRCMNRCNLICSRCTVSGVLTALAGGRPAGAYGEVRDDAGHGQYAGCAAGDDEVDEE